MRAKKDPLLCKKCGRYNNWWHGYCHLCWGEIPKAQAMVIVAKERALRIARGTMRKGKG